MDDYSAFCECDVDGYVEFYSSCLRKAKKEHRCEECRSTIRVGEIYEYASGKQSGDFWDAKTCSTCLALVDYIKAHVPCYCRMHGDLFEDRIQELVFQAQQTPGFYFGIMRRIVACNRRRYGRPHTAANVKP